ncbi:MAG: hypothetical protein ACE5HT_16080 [Gemmatimonadales bacterium]
MHRTFLDDNLLEWEAYVSGGAPNTPASARIYFVSRTDPFERPRWVLEESGDVVIAENNLAEMDDEELARLLVDATPLD